jgi:DNA-binding NtrC family response regulator
MALKQYHWPGNIRELKTVVERLIFSCEQGVITEQLVGQQLEPTVGKRVTGESLFVRPLQEALDELEAQYLQQALQLADNNISEVARLLQEPYQTTYSRIRRRGMQASRKGQGSSRNSKSKKNNLTRAPRFRQK